MSFFRFIYHRFYIFLICSVLWFLGISLLYPIWLFSQIFPYYFLVLFSVIIGFIIFLILYRCIRSKTLSELVYLFLSILKIGTLLFSALVAYVAFCVGMWWKMGLALIFCFFLLCVTIPHASKKS